MGISKHSSWGGNTMKVSDSHGVLRTERISSTERPHSHDIVAVDRPSGRVRETSIGPNRVKTK